ncbi:MAG: hypothetical protein AB7G25_02375 [Sphingomonadaceae bacterium]
MALHRLVVLSNAVDNRDDEFNAWYTDQHLGDVLATPTFVSAQRFELSGAVSDGLKYKYLAIYDIETNDLAASLTDLESRANTERMPVSETLDVPGVYAHVYTPITGLVKA